MSRGSNPRFQRRKAGRDLKVILIVCLGEETEKNYFKAFPTGDAHEVQVEGRGVNPSNLVQKAKGLFDQNPKKYSDVWVVFDRDDFEQDIHKACKAARKEGFQVAYSISCFEFWVLLHFEDGEGFKGYKCKDYCKLIREKYIPDYEKNHPDLYQLLNDSLPEGAEHATRQDLAIERAKLSCSWHQGPLNQGDPSSSVWKLVELLNALARASK